MSMAEQVFWRTYKAACDQINSGWMRAEPAVHRYFTKNPTSGYDPHAFGFAGGEFEFLTERNYQKALRKIWKAEVQAPYLGIKDATEAEKAEGQLSEEDAETKRLVKKITSAAVRKEFEDAYTPEQRAALGKIMSLVAHGEAYALFTSANILTFVEGTGPRLAMAMQVMEEAKHFVVLREMLKALGIAQGIPPSVHILFERIASAPPYRMLFGMNVVLESIATSVFSLFAEAPGLRHVLHQFHMDEARHVGFTRSYAETGKLPQWVRYSPVEQTQRLLLVLPVAPLMFDFVDDIRKLGIDPFEFFGAVVFKLAKLGEEVGFPVLLPRPWLLLLINAIMNAYVRAYKPELFNGFHDYCKLTEIPGIPKELMEVERVLFGIEGYRKVA